MYCLECNKEISEHTRRLMVSGKLYFPVCVECRSEIYNTMGYIYNLEYVHGYIIGKYKDILYCVNYGH